MRSIRGKIIIRIRARPADCRRRIDDQEMVEAAGVESNISIANTQLIDSENACISQNATIAKSSVQTTYKDLSKFPELHTS
jgi:hypothetical protein